MKKLKLNLDDLKVESFETTPQYTNGRGTIFGQMKQGDSLEDCDITIGGGGDVGTNTWCFGENCNTQDYAYTCQDSDPCGVCGPDTQVECIQNTYYNSCGCTNPFGASDCCWYFPSILCWD